jgi:hypothetical protein
VIKKASIVAKLDGAAPKFLLFLKGRQRPSALETSAKDDPRIGVVVLLLAIFVIVTIVVLVSRTLIQH